MTLYQNMNRLRNILTAMAVVAAMAAAAQFPNVVNPEIPAKVTFAGNTVSLDRDDMYERLDRELTMYLPLPMTF